MFNRKKRPVLTATTCNLMENLRLAIEVLSGQQTRFVQIDFNTGLGKVKIGSTVLDLLFTQLTDSGDTLHFHHPLDGWNIARFDQSGEVRVVNTFNPHKNKGGEHSMWWVGRSATERWEEPLHKEEVEYCAQMRGLSVEEYLNS